MKGTRLIHLIIGDIRFQFRYGFYLTYAVFSALYVFLLFVFPESWRRNAASIMIYSDPAAMGLFFMGAIVLLEKSQRVLNALAVSPVKVSEYIAAKVISLLFISLLVSLLLALAAGLQNILMVLVSTILTSIIFSLLGIIAAARINSLNQYAIVTSPIEIICFVPPIIFLFAPSSVQQSALRYSPLSRSIALIANMSQNILLDAGILLAVIVCLWFIAYRSTVRMWKEVGGIKL
jgi:fluoroquinolone transport system permease protein